MSRRGFTHLVCDAIHRRGGKASRNRRPQTRLALETLEPRQLLSITPTAGAPDAWETDNTAAQAKTIRTDGTLQVHSLHTGADVDWVKFTLTQPSNVTIQTDGTSGDTQMWLYGRNNATTLIASDDDSGNGYFSRISRTGLVAGTYYVKIGEYGGNDAIDRYTLSVRAVPGDAWEIDNTAAQAKTIRTDGTLQVRSLHTATDIDWVKFTLADRSNVTIQTDGAAGDTQMWLYGPNIATALREYDDNDGNGYFSQIIRSGTGALAAGTYYVKIGENGNDQPIARYTLRVQATVTGDAYEPDNTAAQARTIRTDGTLQVHSLHSGTDVDWVKFTLAQRSNVTIETDGAAGDTQMWLYGRNNATTLVQFDDDSGNGYFSRIECSGSSALEAGTYYVKIGEYGSSDRIARYTLRVQAQTAAVSRYLLTEHWGGAWTDVEKSPTNTDDDLMCWAAATSNLLVWTGWVQGAGNLTADATFRYFLSHWSDEGGLPEYGLRWWFYGTNPAVGWDGWAQVEVPGGTFYRSQNINDFLHLQQDTSQAMAAANSYLRAGYATALSIYAPGLGHVVTCWGVEYDPANPASLRGVWVTDSDDAKEQSAPPDQLRYYPVALSGGRWYLQGLYGSDSWYIGIVTGLERRPASVALGGAELAGAAWAALGPATVAASPTPMTRGPAAVAMPVTDCVLESLANQAPATSTQPDTRWSELAKGLASMLRKPSSAAVDLLLSEERRSGNGERSGPLATAFRQLAWRPGDGGTSV